MKKINITLTILLIALFITGCTKTYEIDAIYDSSMGSVEGIGTYEKGSTVTLKAIPKKGYTFKKWLLNRETITKDQELTFEVTEDKKYKALFTIGENSDSTPLDYYEVEAISENESIGEVIGARKYGKGTEATLTAIPKEGFEFLRWETPEETLSEEKEFRFVVKKNYDIVARFKEELDPDKNRYTVKVTSDHPEAVYEIYTYKTDTGMLTDEFTENDEASVLITNLPPNYDAKTIMDNAHYKYVGLYNGDKLLTTDFNYDFIVEEDMNLEARFEPLTSDDFTIIKNKSEIFKDIDIPDQFNKTILSPNKRYILGIDEEFIYVINTSDNSLYAAFKISGLIENDNSNVRCTWGLNSLGFTINDNNSITVQLLDSRNFKILAPNFAGVLAPNYMDKWPNDSRFIKNSNLHIKEFNLDTVILQNNYLAFTTSLPQINTKLSLVNLEEKEFLSRKFSQRKSVEGLPYNPSGFAFDKDKNKLIYSFNNSIIPEGLPNTVTGYFDIDRQEDIEISISNLGNYPGETYFNIHGVPLIWLNKTQVLFRFMPYEWYPSIEHLYVLDIEANEIIFIKNHEVLNSSLPIEGFGESNKYINKILSSSYSNKDNKTTIYLSSVNLELKELSKDILEQAPKDYSNDMPVGNYSPEIYREFILSRYDNYYELESEKLFSIEDNLIIREVFADNNNLIATLSLSPYGKENKDNNKHYLVLIDQNMNHELVYESNNYFQAITVDEDSFTILKDNEIQRIDR